MSNSSILTKQKEQTTTIMREDLEADRDDLSDVVAEGMIRPVHPGEILKD